MDRRTTWGRQGWWILALAIGVGGALLFFLILDLGIGDHWCPWESDRSKLGKFNDQCEIPVLDRWVRQRWASWTNAAYTTAGLLVLLRNVWSGPNPGSGRYVGGLVVGSTLFLTGLFSFFFHASTTRLGQTLDIVAIYAMLLAMIIFATASMWEALGERGWAVGICGALLLLSLVAFKRSEIKAFQSEPVVFTLAGIVLALAILFWILRRDEV